MSLSVIIVDLEMARNMTEISRREIIVRRTGQISSVDKADCLSSCR